MSQTAPAAPHSPATPITSAPMTSQTIFPQGDALSKSHPTPFRGSTTDPGDDAVSVVGSDGKL